MQIIILSMMLYASIFLEIVELLNLVIVSHPTTSYALLMLNEFLNLSLYEPCVSF